LLNQIPDVSNVSTDDVTQITYDNSETTHQIYQKAQIKLSRISSKLKLDNSRNKSEADIIRLKYEIKTLEEEEEQEQKTDLGSEEPLKETSILKSISASSLLNKKKDIKAAIKSHHFRKSKSTCNRKYLPMESINQDNNLNSHLYPHLKGLSTIQSILNNNPYLNYPDKKVTFIGIDNPIVEPSAPTLTDNECTANDNKENDDSIDGSSNNHKTSSIYQIVYDN
jgi:hypothetical protein